MKRIGAYWMLAVLSACEVVSQVNRSQLLGTVTDPSGAVVAEAKVGIEELETGLQRQVKTDKNGNYSFVGLLSGSYRLEVSRQGFSLARFEKVEITVGQARTQDVQLNLAGVATTTEVRDAASPVERTDAALSTVILPYQIRALPLNGRNWANLMVLSAGATDEGAAGQRGIRFAGRARDDNNFSFDGTDATGIREQTQRANVRLNIPLDSIAEFRVDATLYTAESGFGAGGQVNVISKNGTNQFHGGAFEYLRNSALDESSPLDVTGKPPLRLNQFGGSVGGPLRKNKAFFFASYEGLRQTVGQTISELVPTPAFRAQVLANSPALAQLLSAYPNPNTLGTDPDTALYQYQGITSTQEDSVLGRVDYNFSDNTTLFTRYNVDIGRLVLPNGSLGDTGNQNPRPMNGVVQLQHSFSPRLLNSMTAGVNRITLISQNKSASPVVVSVPGLSDLNVSGRSTEADTSYTGADTLTIIRGRLTWKAGVEVRRIHSNNGSAGSTAISFASRGDFVNNVVDGLDYTAELGTRGLRHTYAMGFGQVEAKVLPTLTANLGLRYEVYTVAKEVNNRLRVFDLTRCRGFCPDGTQQYDPDYGDLGPRVSLAWAPKRFGGKTVFRTGYGIYYGAGQNDDLNAGIESAVPRYSLSASDVPGLTYPYTPFLGLLQGSYSPRALGRNHPNLYSQSWGFSVQQALPQHFLLETSYIASSGTHLFSRSYVNVIDPVTGRRPLSGFGRIDIKENVGSSNFSGLQFALNRTFSNGLSSQTNYMWSHSINDGSVGGGDAAAPENVACRRCERGNSLTDLRHTFNTNSVYELPFGKGRKYLSQKSVAGALLGGWQLSGIITASTGRAVNVVISRSASQLPDGNNANQRPDLLPNVSIYPPGGSRPGQWLNAAAFRAPARGQWGNAGRAIARGPARWQADTALARSFTLSEPTSLQFRVEVFNLFNRAQYGNPINNVSNPLFGQILSPLNSAPTGSGTPRQIQFVVRLDF